MTFPGSSQPRQPRGHHPPGPFLARHNSHLPLSFPFPSKRKPLAASLKMAKQSHPRRQLPLSVRARGVILAELATVRSLPGFAVSDLRGGGPGGVGAPGGRSSATSFALVGGQAGGPSSTSSFLTTRSTTPVVRSRPPQTPIIVNKGFRIGWAGPRMDQMCATVSASWGPGVGPSTPMEEQQPQSRYRPELSATNSSSNCYNPSLSFNYDQQGYSNHHSTGSSGYERAPYTQQSHPSYPYQHSSTLYWPGDYSYQVPHQFGQPAYPTFPPQPAPPYDTYVALDSSWHGPADTNGGLSYAGYEPALERSPEPIEQPWHVPNQGQPYHPPRRTIAPNSARINRARKERAESESLLANSDGSAEPEQVPAARGGPGATQPSRQLSTSSNETAVSSIFDLDRAEPPPPRISTPITLPPIAEMLKPKSSPPSILPSVGPVPSSAPLGIDVPRKVDQAAVAVAATEPEPGHGLASGLAAAMADLSPLTPPTPSPSPPPVRPSQATPVARKRSTPSKQHTSIQSKRQKVASATEPTPSKPAQSSAKAKAGARPRRGQSPNLFASFAASATLVDQEGKTLNLAPKLTPPEIPYSTEEGGFIAYRRNNLTICASIAAHDGPMFVSSGRTRAKVDRLEAMLTSEAAVGGEKVPLIQLDVSRKLKLAKEIEPADFEATESGRVEASYARVQYRVSTTKSNHAHASEEDKLEKYQLVLAIVAVKGDGKKVEVGRWVSEGLTVRGRSPKNFTVPAAIGKGHKVGGKKAENKSERAGKTPRADDGGVEAGWRVVVGAGRRDGGQGGGETGTLATASEGTSMVGGSSDAMMRVSGRTRSRIKVEDEDVWRL